MVNIPLKLRKEPFRFIKIRPRDKRPYENGWQKDANYNYKNISEHEGNYGIATGYGGLLVVDFDNQQFQEIIVPLLPETFTVKTGSGGLHLYYLCENTASFKVIDAEKNTLADIQGDGRQVVGAGSIHPNGNQYEVINDSDIQLINSDELKALIIANSKQAIIPSMNNEKTQEKIEKFSKDYNGDDLLEKIKNRVSIKGMLSNYGINTNNNPCDCPIHNSRGKKCLTVKDGVWYCFGCGFGGTIFDLVMKKENVTFKKALKILTKEAGLEKEYQQKQEEFKVAKESRKKESTKEIIESGAGVASQIDPLTLAKNFVQTQPIFYDSSKLWWVWENNLCKWEIKDEIDVLNMVHGKTEILGMTTGGFKSALLTALQMVSRKNKPKPVSKTWVQLGTSIYDVKTGKQFSATPEYFVTNPLPYTPSNNEETPFINKLFTEWVEPDNVQLLYEIIAYCMLPDYPLHRIFALTGSGSNGKGCYFRIIEKFIGMDNIASTELDVLTSNRFESSRLYKKLVATMSETNANTLKNTSMLKKLSGGDLIGYEFKNKNGFTDINYAKILLSTNTLPKSTDNTDGFYRRWMIIPFPNSFPETDDPVEKISNEEFSNLAYKSLTILKKILEKRTFTNEGSINKRRERYEAESDPFSKFWKEQIKICENEKTPVFEFENHLNSWLKNNGYNTMSKTEIKNRLESEGIEKKRIAEYEKSERTSNWWYWMEIRIKKGDLITDFEEKQKTQHQQHQKHQPFNSEFPYRELSSNHSVIGVIGVISEFKKITREEIQTITLLSDEKLDEELSKLKTKGEIYEPKPGIYQILE